jgi:NAD-dependent dihydropyrimidine dehydrogenase PreA subunit
MPPVIPVVDRERCSGCGRCVAACPLRLFTLETSAHRKHARLTAPERCDRCGSCIAECPVSTLSFPS